MTNIEECNIGMTFRNGSKMKCELKGKVNMKLQVGKMIMLTEVLYIPQSVKNILSVSRLVQKESAMGDTKDKTTINQNDANMILDARK